MLNKSYRKSRQDVRFQQNC